MKPPLPPKLAKPPKLRPPALGPKRSPLPAMVLPSENVLDSVEQTGDLQTDTTNELDAIKQGFRDRAKAETERRDAATGSGEYVIVCFVNGAQCAAFTAALAEHVRTIRLGVDDLVIDGRELAKHMGIAIPDARAAGKIAKVDRDWSKRSRGP